jgi:outer membrane protein OmpA-like peptidoglycan-associated protein/WD40 repeat protein
MNDVAKFPALLLLLLLPLAAYSQDTSTFEASKPEDLLQSSLKSTSITQKLKVCSYLVKKYPQRVEGLFCKGFIAGYEDRHDQAIAIYRDPSLKDFLPAMFELAGELTGQESIAAYQRVIQSDPAWQNYISFGKIYAVYVSDLHDKQAADKFLAEAETKSPNIYVFDFYRAKKEEQTYEDVRKQRLTLLAKAEFDLTKREEYLAQANAQREQEQQHYAKAVDFYLKAISKQPDAFEPYESLTNLRIVNSARQYSERQENERSPIDDYLPLDVLRPDDERYKLSAEFSDHVQLIKQYSEKYAKLDVLQSYLGKLFSDLAPRDAFAFYCNAFRIKPEAETAEKIYRLGMISHAYGYRPLLPFEHGDISGTIIMQENVRDFLIEANRTLPNNELILHLLAQYFVYVGDAARAADYGEQAIKASSTLTQELRNADLLAYSYEHFQLDYDRAEALYLRYSEKEGIAPADKRDLLYNLVINRRNAQRLDAALTYLGKLEEYSKAVQGEKFEENTYLDIRRELEKYKVAEDRVALFYDKNPFLKYWQDCVGQSLRLTINFAPGSDHISETDYSHMAQEAAGAFQQPDASKYIFLIEGNSDPTEHDETLSLRRAEAVRRYFNQKYNIPLEGMQAIANGPDVPVAPNSSEEGRAKNRRVELVPMGTLAQPTIVATSALRTRDTIAISPDGRLLATGGDPLQLWDTQRKIKVKDLGRGGWETKFSPNGRYLATAAAFAEIGGQDSFALIVYDVKTGLPILQEPYNNEITNFDWDPTGQKIVFTAESFSSGYSNPIVIYDVKNKRISKTRVSPGGSISGGDLVLWSRDGTYIVAGRAQASTLQVYDANDLTLKRELSGLFWPHALAQTKDGKYLVCSDNDFKLTVWDTTNNWSRKQIKVPVAANQIDVHPDKHILVLNDFKHESGSNSAPDRLTILVDLDHLDAERLVEKNVAGSEVKNVFSPDGTKLYQELDDHIDILNAADLKTESSISGVAVRSLASERDPKNNYYLSIDESGVNIWDVKKGTKIHSWNQVVTQFQHLGSEPDRFVGIVNDGPGKGSKVYFFNTSSLEAKDVLTLSFQVEKVFTNDQIIGFAGIESSPQEPAPELGTVAVYDRHSMKLIQPPIRIPIPTARLKYDGLYASGFTAFGINTSATEAVVSTHWEDGFGHGGLVSTVARIFDLKTGGKIRELPIGGAVFDVTYDKANDELVKISTRVRTYVINKTSGKRIDTNRLRSGEHAIPLKNNGNIFWAKNYLQYVPQDTSARKQLLFDDHLVGAEVFEDQNLLITLTNLNEISFFNLSKLEKVLTIIPKLKNEWIAFSPDGAYTASLRGVDKVFWSLGDRYRAFAEESYRERPDLIEERLKSLSEQRTFAQDIALPKPNVFRSPTVKGQPPETDSTSKDSYRFILEITSEAGQPDPTIVFELNNRRIDEAGVKKEKVDGGKSIAFSQSIPLNEGPNSIVAYNKTVDDKGGIHLERLAGTSVERKADPNKPKEQPDLWFLGIAVKDYTDPATKLNYTIKDVTDLQSDLEKQKGSVYKNVHPKILANEHVNPTEIQRELLVLRDDKKGAQPNDFVIIFISGHGVLRGQGNTRAVFLLPYDGKMDDSTSGIDLQPIKAYVASKNNSILFLDICHASEEGDKKIARVPTIDVMRSMSAANAIVIASTSERQVAREEADYYGGHGALAAAILEALDGKSTTEFRQANKDWIMYTELQDYIVRRVKSLTSEAQYPSLSQVNVSDFRFAKSSLQIAKSAATNPLISRFRPHKHHVTTLR